MTTNTNYPSTTKTENNEPIMVIELIDKQESDFVLDGTQGTANPIVLDCPKERRILPNSHIKTRDEKGEPVYKKIRYIKGCPIIDMEQQNAQGYTPNPLSDVIWISGGLMTVVRRGADVSLYDYLKAAMFNEDAEGRDAEYRSIYREVRQQEVAKQDLKMFDMQKRATDFVLSLREAGKGDVDFIYKEDEIDALALLFNVHGLDTPDEKMTALYFVAKDKPEFFLNNVAAKTKTLRVNILSAIQFACLGMTGQTANLTQHDNKTILTFKASEKKRDERMDELTTFFMTPAGRDFYNQMMLDLEAAQAAQA